jgi:hypothetical protein
MEEFLKNFDILSFPGENVTLASLRIKAIAQSLGPTKLPTDIVHRILEGFARSSTPAFSNLCYHQESMISSSLVKSSLRQDTLYKTLISVLGDLEVRYNELLSGQRWLGLGHGTQAAKSVFLTNPDLDEDSSDDEDYSNYAAFTAREGRTVIPFNTWVKDKICRNCDEIGHIQRDCPKPRRRTSTHQQRSRQTKLYHGQRRDTSRSGFQDSSPPSSQQSSKPGFSAKVQALISAACDLAGSVDHQNTSTKTNDNKLLLSTTDDNEATCTDYSSFFTALGVPKE